MQISFLVVSYDLVVSPILLPLTIPYTHLISLTLALWVGKKSCDEPSNTSEIEKWVKLARGGYNYPKGF